MPNRLKDPRVVVPKPHRIRRMGRQGFGWLDARLHRQGWLELLPPEALSVYTFLCLVANREGVSWYRKERLSRHLGISESLVNQSLRRLMQLELLAYQPFHRHAVDGFYQVLEIPEGEPPAIYDLLEGPEGWSVDPDARGEP